ncbi:MAG: helix-turn-helix domain-containing protein [Candidatus Curtissbacteria bacterium]|nr:helix-turn-helix domain-containing protein [Candidatus Curtissbacteria bacterium]
MREFRTEKGLSQADLEIRSLVGQATISMFETGLRAWPSSLSVFRIIAGLDLDPWRLNIVLSKMPDEPRKSAFTESKQ